MKIYVQEMLFILFSSFFTQSSPAIIRKKGSLGSNSFSNADIGQMKSIPSLPILKNRYNTTPEATEETKPGSLAPVGSMISLGNAHQGLRTHPSTIPEEEANASASSAQETHVKDDLEVIADFESDGGGEYEVLAHPEDVQRITFTAGPHLDDDSGSSSDSDSSSTSGHTKNSVFNTIFASSSSSSSSSSTSGEEDLSDLDVMDTHYCTDQDIGHGTSGQLPANGHVSTSGQVLNMNGENETEKNEISNAQSDV